MTASVSERGVVVADRDPKATAARLAHPADRAAYPAMLDELDRRAGVVFGVLGAEPRARDMARLGATALRRLGPGGAVELTRVAVQSGRGFLRERFTGWEADQLWTPWLLHAGLGPDHASGGLMLPVMAATMHGVGLPVVKGGAGRFVAAFERLLADRGVDVRPGTVAERIEVADGRAAAVHAGGRRIVARKAVLASTSTGDLYGHLLDRAAVPENGRRAARAHRPGRAAMQIHLALDRPLRWSDAALDPVPLVHVSDGADGTGIACAQAEAGLLPAEPTIVVGRQALLDPGRAPEGADTLWLQLQELPFTPRGDAAGEIDVAGGWSEDVVAAYVDRVVDRIERFAPGLRASIRGTHALPPVIRTAAPPSSTSVSCGGRAPASVTAPAWPGSGISAPSPTPAPVSAARDTSSPSDSSPPAAPGPPPGVSSKGSAREHRSRRPARRPRRVGHRPCRDPRPDGPAEPRHAGPAAARALRQHDPAVPGEGQRLRRGRPVLELEQHPHR